MVGAIEDGKHKGIKELRPGSTGRTEYRLLFIFDPDRKAIVLVIRPGTGTAGIGATPRSPTSAMTSTSNDARLNDERSSESDAEP
jgi:Phage derived protein Gp49-like (DUF891)